MIGTDALLPVELPHTEAGAVIVTGGNGLMMMLVEPLLEQPAALVTVTFSVIAPLAPAVKVTALDAAPAVMVPLVMAQL